MITRKEVRKFLPHRKKHSVKGDNGRVLVIGGSIDYYGAPVLTALSALTTGADLVHLVVPECNFDVTRTFYPDFIVHSYPGKYLNEKAMPVCEELFSKTDVCVIGMGVSAQKSTTVSKTMAAILTHKKAKKLPFVLDSDAIFIPIPKRDAPVILTPHKGEFLRLTRRPVADEAKARGVFILLKGAEDMMTNPDGDVRVNATGNPGMTVGGTGDVLAGVVASFLAQGVPPFEAMQLSAFLVGFAGDLLFKQKSYGFMATDVALSIPYALAEL